jgi:hypothetical protein
MGCRGGAPDAFVWRSGVQEDVDGQSLVRGAVDAGEPGVCIAFEESPAELPQNVRPSRWDSRHLRVLAGR